MIFTFIDEKLKNIKSFNWHIRKDQKDIKKKIFKYKDNDYYFSIIIN